MNEEKITEARKMLCQYLSLVAKEKGLSTYKIAEITGFKQQNVSRMFAGRYAPSLDNFIKLCDAIGVYIFILEKESQDDLAQIMRDRWRRPGDQD